MLIELEEIHIDETINCWLTWLDTNSVQNGILLRICLTFRSAARNMIQSRKDRVPVRKRRTSVRDSFLSIRLTRTRQLIHRQCINTGPSIGGAKGIKSGAAARVSSMMPGYIRIERRFY